MYDVPMGTGSQLNARSLESAVYETVLERITSGVLKPGDPLVEAQLSEEFGISKTPVREALISLNRDGLVEQAAYKMSRVATPTEADVRQACEIRAWIEGEIAAQHARNPSPELVGRLDATIAEAREGLKNDDLNRYAEAVHAFSDVLLEVSGNRYAIEVLGRLRNILALIANVSQTEPGRRRRSIREHAAIAKAIRKGDEAGARAATVEHLHSIEEDSVRAIRALSG
jgi:GntR family transcriptional regulator, rspAB operon transcriptional repressor